MKQENQLNQLIFQIKNKPHKLWYVGIALSVMALLFGAWGIWQTVYYGLGTWGLNNTVGWGWGITNFVWWVGIGHAGTFISAILLLFHQKWRTGINRSAEAMTIFAILCALFFPIIHMGRPLLFFFAVPYPNTRDLWVNFNSPLVWDVFALTTYFLVSLIFWYSGLIPDLALMRDNVQNKIKKKLYNFFSLGWVGSTTNWFRLETLSRWLAGIAAPLVISVHSIVSYDFATSILPGWHSTIFPPYFVAGAIYSGFAMVLMLMIIARKAMNLQTFITTNHIEKMNRVVLITGSLVGSAYLIEIFTAIYSGHSDELFILQNRMFGDFKIGFWFMIAFNMLLPQFLWSKKIRTHIPTIFIWSILINVGMWFERFVIVVSSLEKDFIPANWSNYIPTITEVSLFIGTLGFFFGMFLLFTRVIPVVSIWENYRSINSIKSKTDYHE